MLATYYMNSGAGQLHRIEPELHGLHILWSSCDEIRVESSPMG